MTLDVGEFIRRFLIHVLPKGFHRICHYGMFASANPAETIARAREHSWTRRNGKCGRISFGIWVVFGPAS